jgi:hypothetical protein
VFHPARAFVTVASLGAFTPHNSKSQGALGPIIGRFNAVLQEKSPERLPLAEQVADQLSRLIFSSMIAIDEIAKPGIPGSPLTTGRRLRSQKDKDKDNKGIPGSPLTTGRRGMGHVAQALEFGHGALAANGKLRIVSLRQAARSPDGRGQTGLALGDPDLRDTVAIRDQDAVPIVNKRQEGCFTQS